MSFAHLKRVTIWIFVLIFATISAELPISELLHGLVKPVIGNGYLLFFCGTFLTIISVTYLVLYGHGVRRSWVQFLFYAALFLIPGALAIMTSAFSNIADVQLSVQQFIFGYAAPVLACLALLGMETKDQRRAWFAFYGGWCLFLLASLVFLWLSWKTATTFSPFVADLTTGQRLFAWRYLFGEPWNLYSIYMGNANKESNYILMFLLFSTTLLGPGEIRVSRLVRFVYFLFWILGVFTLVSLFSRATLLLLPLVAYASGFWKRLNGVIKWCIGGVVGITAAFGYSSLSAVLSYLFTATYIDDASGGALGSFNERFVMWKDLWDYFLLHEQKLLYGLGTAGYGLHFQGTPEAGTHNMFLDTLIESGFLGLACLVLLMSWMVLQSLGYFGIAKARPLELVAAICLVCLMFREHSVSYMYVTSLGGFCIVVLFYLLSEPWESGSKTQPIMKT
jgi:O-antigen ligase